MVLVVDDDINSREALAFLIGQDGYRVVTAVNGADALSRLRGARSIRPSVILLDLIMPVMTGEELCCARRGYVELADIPIVLFSADAAATSIAASLGVECLPKSGSVDELLGVIRRHCD